MPDIRRQTPHLIDLPLGHAGAALPTGKIRC